ncbi:serine hydrolase domain-containing protein [Aestuariirhabdus litorea]|uniref:Class A beta-lactamase-related serine hydrolase n=1 Tax=Aestuariirhabdus litorea TaxID=2528527 RepID=A0A3P3VN57_9GAMM|nr:serine hydrolase domain-containing protein [Aestuariirhabdus litorea]RRJ84040.1 class A beta-lactamase-related serine hydrolase [Aestuariirhabdus litorea]RWW97261.1 class A beta-lactamase-related serine hydrolase [Endozoicomonadaceae bacterium GTF-13]
MSTLQGYFDLRFEPLRDCFAELFAEGEEVGAALSVSIGGELAVDLWAGHTDAEQTRCWEQDTLVNLFSCTKGLASTAALMLVERGLLSLEERVAHYWPEFGCNGKQDIRVEQLLCHSAGLSAIHPRVPDEALFDWGAMVHYIEQEQPWWEPGTRHGYAPVTFGWTLGELFRRVAGETIGHFVQRELMEPLGQELYIGLPEVLDPRVARIVRAPLTALPDSPVLREIMSHPEGVTAHAFTNPMSVMNSTNKPQWRRMELCSANGHGTARSLAVLYDMLANGGRYRGHSLLAPELIERARREQVRGEDAVLGCESRFGLGFLLHQPRPLAELGGEGNFGHQGASGALGFADPERGIGFGYLCNRMGSEVLVDPRADRLLKALYRCL